MTGRLRVLAVAASVVACAAASAPAVVRDGGERPFLLGMALGLFSEAGAGTLPRTLDEIAALGVDAVSLVVPRAIRDVRSAGFREVRGLTPPDAVLVDAIRRARRRGMTVLLFPLVHVEHLEEGEWRGTVAPPDWDAWFAEYEAMILHYARIAEAEGVGILSVGSELCSTEGFRDRWTGLIGRVRGAYRGKLLYSANWDHYREVSFAPALDFVGVNAYYRLTDATRPGIDELLRAWEPIRADLRAWARSHGRPLLFTEVGYPSRAGAATDPWDHRDRRERPADPEGQRRCYRAFVESWRDVPELAGAFFYLWWGEGGDGDRGYTPRGKPAAGELARWYRGAPERGSER